MSADPVIYLCGPITGVPRYWLQFERAEDQLRQRGFVPLNPATLPGGLSHKAYMLAGINMLLSADAVYLLHGWERSEAAKIEKALAEYIGVPIYENIADMLREVPRCF